jgi:hypothetical protein
MATKKRSSSNDDPSPKAKLKTSPFIRESSMNLDPSVYQTDELTYEQEQKEQINTITDDYLNSNALLFASLNFELLTPYEFTSTLEHHITSHGGNVTEGGIKIAPSLKWIRDHNFMDSEVILKSFIEDSIKNNKLESPSRHTFAYIISKAPFIQPGDLVTPKGPSLFIPRESSRRAREYIDLFSAKGTYNCFYAHSQAGKSTFVKTFIAPELTKLGFQVI